MQPASEACPTPPPNRHPLPRSSGEFSENEGGAQVPSSTGASLYHDISKSASDGDLFDEHDKITRFLFQVRCYMPFRHPFTPPVQRDTDALAATLCDDYFGVSSPSLPQRVWQHGAVLRRQCAARHQGLCRLLSAVSCASCMLPEAVTRGADML